MTQEHHSTSAEDGTPDTHEYTVTVETHFLSSHSLREEDVSAKEAPTDEKNCGSGGGGVIATTKGQNDVIGSGDVTEEGCDVTKSRDVDGGWAWVVLVTSSLSLAIQELMYGITGMFQVEFQATFGGSRGLLALIGSIFITLTGMLGPLAGALSTQLTPRVTLMLGGALVSGSLVAASFVQTPTALLLTYGILGGLGNALIFTPAVTTYSRYFVRLRQLANGVIMASSGVGSLVGPYLARRFIDTHGWRFSLATSGFLAAQTCVLGALVFPLSGSQRLQRRGKTSPGTCSGTKEKKMMMKDCVSGGEKGEGSRSLLGEKGEHDDDSVERNTEFRDRDADSLRRRVYRVVVRKEVWIVCVNQMLLMTGYNIELLHQPSYIRSVGLGAHHFPNLYLAFGLSMMFIRLVGGFVFTRYDNQLIPAMFLSEVTMALTLGLLPVYGVTLPALFVTNVLAGLSFGVAFMLNTPILVSYIGVDLLPLAYGLMLMCCGSASIFSVSLAGLLYDFLGTYKASFYLAGSLTFTGALVLLLLSFVPQKKAGKDKTADFAR